jgi:hypothetical protein
MVRCSVEAQGQLYLLPFIQYIHSYPPYLQTVPSIRNLRTRYAVVTSVQLNVGQV